MRAVAVCLLVTYAFFFEYLPPAKSLHLWSDIEGYHYPLLVYARKALGQGRVPLWDPSIYCGVPFAGNIQAGLFYPPNWLLLAANARTPSDLSLGGDRVGVSFLSVEALAFLHVALLLYLSYDWLRHRTSHWLPAALGAMVASLGGYVMSQMNHLGVLFGYVWMPLALRGIDQVAEGGLRALWKVAASAALCLLAGYPPTMVGFVVTCVLYSAAHPGRRRLVPLTLGALVWSMLLAAVQLMPTVEAAQMKQPEAAFGAELPFGNGIYGTMLLPNWFDQNRTRSGPEGADGDYLYLGAPALFALAYLIGRGGRFTGAPAAVLLIAGTWFLAADPFGIILRLVGETPLLMDVVRRYNLLPGMVLGVALLVASATDNLLKSRTGQNAKPAWPWALAALAWCGYLLVTNRFGYGATSAIYPAVTLAVAGWGVWLLRRDAQWIPVLIAACVLCEFHAFGTNRRFNGADGSVDAFFRGDARVGGPHMIGLADGVYQEIRRHPDFRVMLHESIQPTDLRMYGLATPQGFDPFLSVQYRDAIGKSVRFTSNRLFTIDPDDVGLLHRLGVRWVITPTDSSVSTKLESDGRFRKLLPADTFFVAFELLDAQPAWRFSGHATARMWSPERRSFLVDSTTPGAFVLTEQFFPGWKSRIDGKSVPVSKADGTFQSIDVPTGQHTVEFEYAPASLYIGAAVSAASIAGLVAFTLRSRHI